MISFIRTTLATSLEAQETACVAVAVAVVVVAPESTAGAGGDDVPSLF